MSKALLFGLPFLTVLVLIFALFVVGAPQPYRGARLYGGTTEGVSVLSWRVSVVERIGEFEAPIASERVSVEIGLPGGRKMAWRGELDALGMAAPRFELGEKFPNGSIAVEIVSDASERASLGRGSVWLARGEWLTRARRGGGWIDGSRSGDVLIRAAPGRGAFAVPFQDPLLIEVRGVDGLIAGAVLEFEPDGMDLPLPPGGKITTDAEGRAVVKLTPREHAVSLKIRARAPSGAAGDWHSLLPVVPGALRATLRGESELYIESPIVRDVAFFALLSPDARLDGRSVRLDPDGRGGSVSLIRLPALPAGPLWGVVSSEPELDTGGTVGWPLRAPEHDVAHSFAVPDSLLLDTLPQGYAKDAERRRRARWIAGVFTLAAIGLVWLMMLGRARAAAVDLAAHFERAGADLEGAERIAPPGLGWRILVAALCVALGFMVMALVAMYRIG